MRGFLTQLNVLNNKITTDPVDQREEPIDVMKEKLSNKIQQLETENAELSMTIETLKREHQSREKVSNQEINEVT
jgi:hypothetical protein